MPSIKSICFELGILMMVVLLNHNMVMPNGSEIDEFFESGVTIGYDRDNLLFCEPEFTVLHPELSSDYIYGEINKQNPHQPYHLVPLPDSFAEEKIKDVPGDTVMVLWSGGTFKTIIDDILYFEGNCYGGFVCILEPITEITNRPKRFREFIALRKEKFYDGPIIPYSEYQIDDSSYLAITDSLTELMTRTWLAEDSVRFEENLARMPEYRKDRFIARRGKLHADPHYPFNDIHFYLYGIESEEIPDMLYLSVVGDLTYATEFSWCARLELTRTEGGWETRTIREPFKGSAFRIRFAFDLNGDGELEYFINNSIYIFIDGEFTPVLYGPYRGC